MSNAHMSCFVSGLLYPKSIIEFAHQKVNIDRIDAEESGLEF